MVEIALALLVASVGLLSLFGLFPAGVKMNKSVVDETQAALFAEQVLNGVRAQAATQRWDRITTGIRLPPPTPDVWYQPENLAVIPTQGATDAYVTNRYEKLGTRTINGIQQRYLDFGIRYRLEIRDIDARRKLVRLYVRPGEFGQPDPTYIFYTELYNHGQR